MVINDRHKLCHHIHACYSCLNFEHIFILNFFLNICCYLITFTFTLNTIQGILSVRPPTLNVINFNYSCLNTFNTIISIISFKLKQMLLYPIQCVTQMKTFICMSHPNSQVNVECFFSPNFKLLVIIIINNKI